MLRDWVDLFENHTFATVIVFLGWFFFLQFGLIRVKEIMQALRQRDQDQGK